MSRLIRRFRNHMRKLIIFGVAEDGGVPAGTTGTPLGLLLIITETGS